jgi:hypothetical protein
LRIFYTVVRNLYLRIPPLPLLIAISAARFTFKPFFLYTSTLRPVLPAKFSCESLITMPIWLSSHSFSCWIHFQAISIPTKFTFKTLIPFLSPQIHFQTFPLRPNCKDTIPKFETNIPRKGTARPPSQFSHSCVCEGFIYSQDRSAYSAAGKYVDRSWKCLTCLQTHECEN